MNGLLTLSLLILAAAADAGQFGGFQQHASAASLKPFASDLGALMGASTFHGARTLGVTGWDVGIRGSAMFTPHPDDSILRGHAVDSFGVPWVQAGVGMPFKFDGFVRGTNFQGVTIAGGGLHYGLWNRSDAPWAPQLMLSGAGHALVHEHFSATHLGGNVVASIGIPTFTMYAGGGIDRTRLTARSSIVDPSVNGASVNATEGRFTGGFRVKPWPFFYVNAAAVVYGGRPGAECGLGLRF